MSQRNSGYDRKPLDCYDTPGWVTDALLRFLVDDRRIENVWEPAAGAGLMMAALAGCGCKVLATDLLPRHPVVMQLDFMQATLDQAVDVRAIITNPPFGEAGEQFVERALMLMREREGIVAMLFRADFDSAISRRKLFADHPAFAKKIVLTRRIVWFVEADGKPKASPSFNHAWFIWDWKHRGPPTIGYAP